MHKTSCIFYLSHLVISTMELTTTDSTEMTDKTTTIGGNKVHLRNYNNTPKTKLITVNVLHLAVYSI